MDHIFLSADQRIKIEALDIENVVDTTAGDLYAAGFLFGYTSGRDLETCGKLGSLAAGIVIQQIGPRPMVDLKSAAQKLGLI